MLFNNAELSEDQSLLELVDTHKTETKNGSLELQLVLIPFREKHLGQKLDALEAAVAAGASEKVEHILRTPIHPDPPPRLAKRSSYKLVQCMKGADHVEPIYGRSALLTGVQAGNSENLGL